MVHHAIALYVGKQLTSNMFVAMPILAIQLSLYICNMDMCKILLILNLFFRSIYFNVLKYLLFLISLVNIHLYILIYIYANVLNHILFQSILTNILCMFYVSKKKHYIYYTCMYYYIYLVLITLFYMYYCCHFKYSVCLLWFYVSLFYSRFVGK